MSDQPPFCVKHGQHEGMQCPQCAELDRARDIVQTTYIQPASRSSKPSAMLDCVLSEMEEQQKKAADHYFRLRPQLLRSLDQEALFRAGFEHAFVTLWRPDRDRSSDETNCSDPGWEMRGGDLTCKGCGRKAREIFTDHDQEKASAAAVHLLSPKRCPDCGVQYVSGARHFSGCPSHPGESAQKAEVKS